MNHQHDMAKIQIKSEKLTPFGGIFPSWSTLRGTADIFRGFMVSLYGKGKENGHVQAYAPTGAMGLK